MQTKGIPVILIYQNHISPLILDKTADYTVTSETKVVDPLNRIADELLRDIKVKKRGIPEADKGLTKFEMKKLQKSLKSACAQAGIDNEMYLSIPSQRVRRGVLTKAFTGVIATEAIKATIFETIESLAEEHCAEYAEFRKLANTMKDTWNEFEQHSKIQQRDAMSAFELACEEVDRYEEENAKLRFRLLCHEYQQETSNISAESDQSPTLESIL